MSRFNHEVNEVLSLEEITLVIEESQERRHKTSVREVMNEHAQEKKSYVN